MKDLSGLVELLIREKGWKRLEAYTYLINKEQEIHDKVTYKTGKINMNKSYYILATGYLLKERSYK